MYAAMTLVCSLITILFTISNVVYFDVYGFLWWDWMFWWLLYFSDFLNTIKSFDLIVAWIPDKNLYILYSLIVLGGKILCAFKW